MEVNEQEFIYPTYKDKQDYLGNRVLISVIIRAILQVVGLFGNVHLVFAVFYNPHLQSCSGILLALTAISGCIHHLSLEYFVFNLFGENHFITLKTCYYGNLIPNFGFFASIYLTFFLALDRLICVLFPISRHHISKKWFVGTYVTISIGATIYTLFFSFKELHRVNMNQMVFCHITDAFIGDGGVLCLSMSLVICLISFVCYIAVWLFWKICHQTQSTGNRKMFKSLFIICVVLTVCWISVCSAMFFMVFFTNFSKADQWFIRYDLTVLTYFSHGCNYFVLWFCSKDFRRVFKVQLAAYNCKSTTKISPNQPNQKISSMT